MNVLGYPGATSRTCLGWTRFDLTAGIAPSYECGISLDGPENDVDLLVTCGCHGSYVPPVDCLRGSGQLAQVLFSIMKRKKKSVTECPHTQTAPLRSRSRRWYDQHRSDAGAKYSGTPNTLVGNRLLKIPAARTRIASEKTSRRWWTRATPRSPSRSPIPTSPTTTWDNDKLMLKPDDRSPSVARSNPSGRGDGSKDRSILLHDKGSVIDRLERISNSGEINSLSNFR